MKETEWTKESGAKSWSMQQKVLGWRHCSFQRTCQTLEIISFSTEDFYGILAPSHVTKTTSLYPPPPSSQPAPRHFSIPYNTDLGSAYPRIRTTTIRMGKQHLRAAEPYSPLHSCQDEAKQGLHNTDWVYYSESKPKPLWLPVGKFYTHPGWRGNVTLLKHAFYISVLIFLHALPLPQGSGTVY